MPGFFNQLFSSARPYSSSQAHRNAERSNAFTEVIGASITLATPAGIIPTKLAQAMVSVYTVFRADTHISEKLIHGLQGLIALTQLGLAATLVVGNQTCEDEQANASICKAAFLCQLLYSGALAVAWAPSEFYKDPYTEPTPPQAVIGV